MKALNNQRTRVLNLIRDLGDATSSEIMGEIDILRTSLSPILTYLRKDGLIRDTGRRRPNVRGRDEIVFAP